MKINGRVAHSPELERFIGGSLFVNDDYCYATEQGRIPANSRQMYQAAKRFAESDRFDSSVSIYRCHIEGRRWHFDPCGKRFAPTGD